MTLATELTGPALDEAVEKALGTPMGCWNADGSENRERLADAVFSGCRVTSYWKFRWNGQDFEIGHIKAPDFRRGYGGVQGNSGYGVWFWDHRHGHPWQSALEAHVAAYRVPARPFHRDLALAVGLLPDRAMIDVRRQAVIVTSRSGKQGRGIFAEFPDASDDERRVLAMCHAIARSFLAAKEVQG